ncbi:MAG TPA: TraR/DksA C4-type zinc finger protein [Candidatus Acidoferrales bacterium]|nr:TraR/DksA C4-type zinc finger protein [Candidatus Acidoferrales bacterium]
MDQENLNTLRGGIFSRIRNIVLDRYGQDIPMSLIEDYPQTEAALKRIERLKSFKADDDLLNLFEAFHKIVTGSYGHCLFCRKEIDVQKLRSNPLAKFCDECEKTLNLANNARETDHLLSIY